MAHLRKHPMNGRPQVRWRDPATGKQHGKTFLRVADARDFKTKLEYELRRGIFIDPRDARTTFGEWAETWRKSWLQLSENTVLQRDSLLRSHVLPSFGDMAIGHITQPNVQTWVTALKDAGYAPWTIDNSYRLLKAALDGAVVAGLIQSSPCVGVKKPSVHKDRKEMHFLSPEELARLAAEADDLSPLVLVAGWLGLRWGEVRGLRRKRLNVLKGELIVEDQLIEPQGNLRFAPLKTAASRRRLAIPSFLNDVLKKHLAVRDCGSDDLVFVGRDGSGTTWENYGHLFEGFEERLSHRLKDLYQSSDRSRSGIGS